MTFTAAVAGATGYAGGEVLRLLIDHPEAQIGALCANSSTGLFGEHQPHLAPLADREVEPTTAERLAEHDVVFLGLPHGKSAGIAAEVVALNPDAVVVDLGADHRLINPADWEKFYPGEFSAPWTYGMPELASGAQRAKLAGTKRIAAPGCNASAVTFAAQPAYAAGLASDDVVAVLSVGYSGAGKTAKTHLLASEGLGSAAPYSVGGVHRHIPEIRQNLMAAGGNAASISMTPVLVPMSRGIIATVSMQPARPTSAEEVEAAYREALAGEPFVRWSNAWPNTATVLGSNSALVRATYDDESGRITAICVIDNLVKGTAGAAIQSLNIALGLPETTGLSTVGVAP